MSDFVGIYKDVYPYKVKLYNFKNLGSAYGLINFSSLNLVWHKSPCEFWHIALFMASSTTRRLTSVNLK